MESGWVYAPTGAHTAVSAAMIDDFSMTRDNDLSIEVGLWFVRFCLFDIGKIKHSVMKTELLLSFFFTLRLATSSGVK